MLHAVDGNAGLDPARSAVGVVEEAVSVLVDRIRSVGVQLFYLAPCERPGYIRQAVFLLNVFVYIDCIQF